MRNEIECDGDGVAAEAATASFSSSLSLSADGWHGWMDEWMVDKHRNLFYGENIVFVCYLAVDGKQSIRQSHVGRVNVCR